MSRCLTLCSAFCVLLFSLGIQAQELPSATAEHEHLKSAAGTWHADLTMYAPGEEPSKTTGTEVNSMVGEFWLTSKFNMDFMGMPFEGHSVSGYDPVAKKFVGFWYDSMSPWGMHMEGSWDADTRTMTWKTHGRDMMGNEQHGRIVESWVDANTRKFEMSHTQPGSDEMQKVMEITYKRGQ